jgi:hypothetical protein
MIAEESEHLLADAIRHLGDAWRVHGPCLPFRLLYAPWQFRTNHDAGDRTKAICILKESRRLGRACGLAEMETERAADATANPNLGKNWNIVKDWTEQSRYERHSLAKAQRLYEAVTHANDGVLPWIKARW